uniref:Universal stress protein n=1 Tax=Archaeoglobus fulgidus TaxID=2234 RepID=A0A7J2TKW9_ARCFL
MVLLVALDVKSDRSERVIAFSIAEAKLRKEKLVFVHSLYGGDKTSPKEIEEGEKLLKWAEEIAKREGVEFETKLLVRGKEPAEDIVDFADEINASLIIIGVRKRRPAGKVLFGSVAQDIILHATKPVVCIK